MKNQKGVSTLIGIIIIIAVAIITFGGFFVYKYFLTQKENNQQNLAGNNQQDPTACITDNDCPQPKCPVTTDTNVMTKCIGSNGKCINGKCVLTSTNQPLITVTSPNGGEVYTVGQNFDIKWTSQGIDKSLPVGFSLIDSQGKEYGASFTGVTPTIGDGGSSTSFGASIDAPVPVGKYMVSVYVLTKDASTRYLDKSDNYFSVIASTTQPSITITSPNGGETWKIGETQKISWQAIGMTGKILGIGLDGLTERDVNTGDNYTYNINTFLVTPTTPSYYLWTIPSNIPPAQYKIKIWNASNADPLKETIDYSNNYFTITTQPSITSILPNSAGLGSTITVTGTNLCGFESDRNLVIENSAGQKGVVYGSSDSTCNVINFTLADKYCTTDMSYIGLPCPSYINIVAGTYNIYSRTPSGTSNRVSFSIVP